MLATLGTILPVMIILPVIEPPAESNFVFALSNPACASTFAELALSKAEFALSNPACPFT